MKDDKMMQYLRGTAIQQYKTDVGFRTLVECVNENMYIIPKYQRKYRWNREQLVGLVESLIRGLPIPPIYTCRNSANQLEILDGQQRVMSLFFYYIGYFLNKRKNSAVDFSCLEVGEQLFKDALMDQFVLDELHIEMEDEDGTMINADYVDLPKEVKRILDYRMITVIEIKIDGEAGREDVLRTIFANLNRGGVLLSNQEQRNGIYNCKFYDMLQEFNKNNKKWRAIWGGEDSQAKDVETLLRLCAMKKNVRVVRDGEFIIDNYKGQYVKMLDQFSKESMKFDIQEIEEYKSSLERFVELFEVTTTFSNKVALLEGFYVVYEKMHMHTKITQRLFERVIDSEDYKISSTQGTSKMKQIKERWKAVYEISCRNDLSSDEYS